MNTRGRQTATAHNGMSPTTDSQHIRTWNESNESHHRQSNQTTKHLRGLLTMDAIVLAVPMVLHDPAERDMEDSASANSSADISPAHTETETEIETVANMDRIRIYVHNCTTSVTYK